VPLEFRAGRERRESSVQPEVLEEQDYLACLDNLEHLDKLVDRAFRDRPDLRGLRVQLDLPAGPVQQVSPVRKDPKARPECKVALVLTESLE